MEYKSLLKEVDEYITICRESVHHKSSSFHQTVNDCCVLLSRLLPVISEKDFYSLYVSIFGLMDRLLSEDRLFLIVRLLNDCIRIKDIQIQPLIHSLLIVTHNHHFPYSIFSFLLEIQPTTTELILLQSVRFHSLPIHS